MIKLRPLPVLKFLLLISITILGIMPGSAQGTPLPPLMQGPVKIGDTMTGTAEQGQEIIYTFDAAADQVITIVYPPGQVSTEVLDAAGNQLQDVDYLSGSPNAKEVFQFPASGTYQLTFFSSGTYIFSIEDGNTLHIGRGAINIGKTVSGNAADRNTVIDYTLDLTPGTTYTIKCTGATSELMLTDGSGNFVRATQIAGLIDDSNKTRDILYQIPNDAQAPFKLERTGLDGDFTLTVTEGDDVQIFRDPVSIGGNVKDSVTEPTKLLIYPLNDVQTGQTISLSYQGAFGDVFVTDADGNYVSAIDGTSTYENNIETDAYLLSGNAPYTITRVGDSGEFTIGINNFDSSSAVAVPASNPEDVPVLEVGKTLTGIVSADQPHDFYFDSNMDQTVTFELNIGADITIKSTDDPDEIIGSQLALKGGPGTSATTLSYHFLSGDRFILEISDGDGLFILNAQDGDLLRTDLGTLALGDSKSGTLASADTIDYFTIDAPATATIGLQYAGAGAPRIIDQNGAEVFPEVTITDNASSTQYGLYQLVEAPDTLQITGTGDVQYSSTGSFNLTLLDGAKLLINGDSLSEGKAVNTTVEDKNKIVEYPITFEAEGTVTVLYNDVQGDCSGGTEPINSTFAFLDKTGFNSAATVESSDFDSKTCTLVYVYQTTTDFKLGTMLRTGDPGTYRVALLSGDQSKNKIAIAAFGAGSPVTANTSDSAASTSASTATCSVSTSRASNIRSQPNTTSAVAGTLAAGASADANGQAVGADGIVWWQLASGGWVRSDVVTETGDCTALPSVNP